MDSNLNCSSFDWIAHNWSSSQDIVTCLEFLQSPFFYTYIMSYDRALRLRAIEYIQEGLIDTGRGDIQKVHVCSIKD